MIQKERKPKKCKTCGKEFYPFNSLNKYCSFGCAPKVRFKPQGKPLPKVSAKKKKTDAVYDKNRKILIGQLADERGFPYCQHCRTLYGGFTTHHIIYRSEKPDHPEIHNIKNLYHICLEPCHKEFHDNKSLRNELVKERELDKLFGNDVLDK